MKLIKPKFWDKDYLTIQSIILYPFTFIVDLRNFFYNFIQPKKYSKIKTICVGNIYLGGTGKTSLSLKIHEILNKKNVKTCFIKKDYTDQRDEQKLLENSGKLFKSKRRKQSLIDAINDGYKVAIFDDGLQDYSIDYDLIFVCFNDENWIGNGFTIPSGPLREHFKNIRKYKNIFITGNMENLEKVREKIFKINPKANIFISNYIPLNLSDFNDRDNYLVFSGIGNHKSFISMLKKNNVNILKDVEFPDHYNYSEDDIKNIISEANKINCKIITTEKDFLRLSEKFHDEINFIKSDIEIQNENSFINILLN